MTGAETTAVLFAYLLSIFLGYVIGRNSRCCK